MERRLCRWGKLKIESEVRNQASAGSIAVTQVNVVTSAKCENELWTSRQLWQKGKYSDFSVLFIACTRETDKVLVLKPKMNFHEGHSIVTLDMLLAFSSFSFLLNRAAWCIFCVYVILCPDPSPGNETLAHPHQLPEWWWLQESSWMNPPRNVWLSMARLPLPRQPGPSDLVSAELQKPPCLKSREL